jgi:hypothetical protein
MAIRIFKLELRNPETKERIDFGPRKLGETGRDILIVKRALGAVVDYSSLVDPGDQNPSLEDPDGWFDCTTGVKLSKMEAATFDSNMQKFLIKFQLDNQFHILNYLFTKFSVNRDFEELQKIEKDAFASFPNYQERQIQLPSGGSISVVPGILPSDELNSYLNSRYTSTLIDLVFRLFDLEMGTLGEATLAVMHGWRPRTSMGATSYHHNPRVFTEGESAYDVVLLGLYAAFVQGTLTQKLEDTPEILEPRADFSDYIGTKEKGIDFLRRYEDQVSSSERLRFGFEESPDDYVIRSSYFGALRYNIVPQNQRSVLYDAMISVTTEQPIENSDLSQSAYDSLRRAFEPDPLTDPPPFDIDSTRIGFFQATEYTLNNLPPKFEEGGSPTSFLRYQTEIKALEDSALDAILKFYNKPDLWILDPESTDFKDLYTPPSDVFPNHDATYADQTKYVLSTNTSIETYNLLDAAEKYDIIEREFEENPLIKFIEFRSPSLRPGDVYRAKFEINREKLALIQEGVKLREAEELSSADTQPTAPPAPDISVSCDGDPVDEMEQQRRYEEYRALANKRKREIARILRENALENYNNNQSIDQTSADLGVFGNANVTVPATELVSGIVDTLTSGRRQDISQVSNPKFSSLTELRITFFDLERMLNKTAENLRSAQKNCNKDNVTITPSDFNGNTEAARLTQIAPQLRRFINSRFEDFEFGTDDQERLRLQGFSGLGTSTVRFEFAPSKRGDGLEVIAFSAAGEPVKSVKNLLKEVPALKSPRTVGYLAQVEEMSESPGFLGIGISCEDIGLGKKGLAYIVKHTMKVSGFSRGEYNPIELWTKNNITDPIENWRNIKEIIDIENQLKTRYGTDEILNVFGNQCISIKQFYEEFRNRFTLSGLLCDYIKCIRIPSIDFKIPKLSIPPTPDFRIFGWYAQLIETLIEKWNEFLAQILCAFAKALLDILRVPCSTQLQDELYGSASGATPIVKRALVEGLADLNLSDENIEKSKQLIDEMALFLTGEELCRILQGGEIDSPTMNMILRLAERIGIEETDTEDALRAFFETISIFLPSTFCENLSQSTSVIGSASCAETSSFLDQIRRRMLANDATDEEIQQAVDMANKNLLGQAEALRRLGEEGLNAVLPSVMDFNDPNSLLPGLPPELGSQISSTVASLFEPAKIGYVSSLSNFGPALFLNSNRLADPTDPEYNQESNIIVQTILENLKLYTAMRPTIGTADDPRQLTQQLAVLHQIYALEIVGGKYVTKIYADNDATGNRIPQALVGNDAFPYIGYEVAKSTTRPLFLKPVGFMQDGFFAVGDNGNILRQPPGASATPLERLGDDLDTGVLRDFTFVTAYKLIRDASQREDGSVRAEDVNNFLRERINERLQQLQGLLQVHLENISRMVNEESYLKVLRDALKITFETRRENQADPTLTNVEIVDVEQITPSRQAIDLKFRVPALGALRPTVTLNEFASTGQTNRFDPYTIEVKGSPLFGQDQVFEYCDTVPGPGLNEETITADESRDREIFERAIEGIPPGIYTRRELFARKFWESVKRKVDFVYDNIPGEQQRPENEQETRQRRALDNYLNNFLRNHLYNSESPRFFEGVFEQVLFSLRKSRIYDEENYYPDFKRRVNGEAYFSEEQGCYKNRYNVSQFGMISFEKIVTDDIAQQIALEMSKPENNLYNLDVDDPSPIDKAIQNVCLIGFVRICILELVLKGSIAYPVWDVEGVADEPFMRDFFIRFVEEEIKRHPSLSDKWEQVAERVTGIEQPKAALRDIVQKQLTKIQGLSKKIFQNDPDADYFNWFIKFFVPQTEVSRIIANRDTAGTRIVGDREDVPDKIFWEHPILSPGVSDRALSLGPRPGMVGDYYHRPYDLLAGNDPFFHIEHCLEVMGPLADLENLVLPTNEIMAEILNADPNSRFSTDLGAAFGQFRDSRRLSITDAYERTSLPRINLNDYDISSTIELPPGARGSAAETPDDLNALHEIYHVDDFVDSLNAALNYDHLEKIILHHRGLMHYDENPAIAPGGVDRNTPVREANARPEAIRRVPTRFITTKRRIIKFEQDFVSHEKENLFPDNNFSLRAYTEELYNDPITYSESENDAAGRSFNNLRNKITQPREVESKYYILPSNGEELLALRARGFSVREALDDGRFSRYITEENGAVIDDLTPAGSGVLRSKAFRNEQSPEDPKNTYIQAVQPQDRGRGRSLRKDKTLSPEGIQSSENDILRHRRNQDGQDSETIFENKLGLVDAIEFEQIKEQYGPVHEETWVETVFDFSDSASIIAGLFGSFTIGETFDPAVFQFASDFRVSRALREDLQSAMDKLYADRNSADLNNGAPIIENASIRGMKDEKLSQYGRVLYTKQTDDPERPDVFIARPMGINPKTNTTMTHHWLTDFRSSFPPSRMFEYKGSDTIPADQRKTGDQKIAKQRESRKHVLSHSGFAEGSVPSANEIYPPNFYKIPMRVLVTQVYISEGEEEETGIIARRRRARMPSEVYCRVVPPRYIRDLHNAEALQENIENLNAAISQIMTEYRIFVDSFLQTSGIEPLDPGRRESVLNEVRRTNGNFPDFSTDFTRDHIADRENPNVDEETPVQYCSIERIYSKVFENETKAANYNSTEELDDLFKHRGSLLSDDRPAPQGLRGIPGVEESRQLLDENGAHQAWTEDRVYDYMRAMQSYNSFYKITKDQHITTDQMTFHKTVFSLKNIFKWYLKSRRDNTLWGALTPPLGLTRSSSRFDRKERPSQLMPLAMSYSENLSRPGTVGRLAPGELGRRNVREEWDITEDFPIFAEWAIGVLPDKRYDLYRNVSRDSFDDRDGPNLDGDKRETWQQPGLVTLYPGSEDVNNIESYVAPGERGQWYAEINKGDMSSWNFYSAINGPGLVSDGPGSQLVNYNRYEHTPFNNVGASPFLADGIISFTDLKTFMKTLISKLLLDSGLSRRLNTNFDIYNFDSFYRQNSNRNAKVIIELLRTRDPSRPFGFDGVELYRRNPGNLRVSEEDVNSLVRALLRVIERLYVISGRQAAFRNISEATQENMEILHTPYKLRLLYRLVQSIQRQGHNPEQNLMLLAVFSSYNLETNILYAAHENSRRNRGGAVNSDREIYNHHQRFDRGTPADSPILDWAVACIHFMAVAHRRGAMESNDIFGNQLEVEYNSLRDVFTTDHGRAYYLTVDDLSPETAGRRSRSAMHENVNDVGYVAGEDHADRDAETLWGRIRTRILDDVQRGNITVIDVIRLTNRLFESVNRMFNIVDPEEQEIISPDAQDWSTFRNSHLIFEALNNPNFSPPIFSEKYENKYREAFTAFNVYKADVTASPNMYVNIQEAEYIRGLLSFAQTNDIREGNISNFITKLDYAQFRDMFTDNNTRFARDVRYISDIIEGLVRPLSRGETMEEYYKAILPELVTSGARLSSADHTINRTYNVVDRFTNRWNDAYGQYTGITSALLGEGVLSNAVLSSRVLRDLAEQSEINQVCRLVANAFVVPPADRDAAQLRRDAQNYNTFVTRDDGVIQQISEEFRTFHMFGINQEKIFSVPVAEAKKQISGPKVGIIDCFDLSTFREDYINLQPWLTDQLIESPDAKQIFQYIFPVKRYQAVSTAFVTSCLAGYSNMPSILQTPKASLAALMGIVTTNRRDRAQLLGDFSQGEFLKQMMDNPTSSHKGLECFDFPYPEDFIKQFVDLLTELFTSFPSIFFRGIASIADPAYKEMKLHWENCDIDKLTFSGVQFTPTYNEEDMTAGLVGEPDGNRDSKYAMILPSYYIDIYTITAILAANPLSTSSWEKFGRVIERLAGYIIKGNISLLDQGFSFQSSCREDGVEWPGSEDMKPWNFDRYGHPVSPLTALALMFPELKGEIRQRELAGCPNNPEAPYSREAIESNACEDQDSEDSPFGPISDLGEE